MGAALLSGGPASPQDAVFRATERLAVVGGETAHRVFARASSPQRLLLLSRSGRRAVVDLERLQVDWWSSVAADFEQTVELGLPRGAARWSGSLALEDGEARFLSPDGVALSLGPRPPLRGLHDRERLLARLPSFGPRSAAYTADGAWLDRLRRVAAPEIEVLVIFGSWCASCEAMLPRVLELDRILGPLLRFEYLAVAPSGPQGRDPSVVELGVARLPAAIVRHGGLEIGRLDGTDDFRRPERSLARLLRR